MKHPIAKSLTVATVVIAASYLAAPELRANGRATDPVAASSGATGVSDANLAQLDRQIVAVETEVAKTPTSSQLDFLSRLYLSRGRITGDATTYALAQSASERSVKIAPRNPEARTILANVRYANHEFTSALDLGKTIAAEDPKQYDALVVVGDASTELGDYAMATRVFDGLARSVPGSAAVTVRQARLAFLHGDVAGAKRMAATALSQAKASGAFGANLAFYSSFRGQLSFDSGDYGASVGAYMDALEIAPADRVATFGLARSLAAQGKRKDAIRVLTALTNRYPDPAALALLGDVLRLNGDSAKADDAYAVVEATAALARSNRRIYDRQLVLFYTNHDRRLDEALRLAQTESAVRKDVYGEDALAWAEYKAGNLDAAASASQRALALGTPDASFHFHAGMIAIARHDVAGAKQHLRRALAISPHFDPVHAPAAVAALASLR